MRIAAGVLMILMALTDLGFGFSYLFFGTLANAGGQALDVGKKMQQQQLEDFAKKLADPKTPAAEKDMILKQKKAMEDFTKDITKKQAEDIAKGLQGVQSFGTTRTPFGIFLLVLGGLGIAAAVVLFMAKASIFALIVGVLQIVAEVVSVVIGFAPVMVSLPFALPGLITGIFVIVAALFFYPKAGAGGSADDDDDDRPRKRRRRDEEEEEEEEERPRRRPAPPAAEERPRVRRPAPPADEEERPRRRPPADEDEDDDDAPPPPRRARSSKRRPFSRSPLASGPGPTPNRARQRRAAKRAFCNT